MENGSQVFFIGQTNQTGELGQAHRSTDKLTDGQTIPASRSIMSVKAFNEMLRTLRTPYQVPNALSD